MDKNKKSKPKTPNIPKPTPRDVSGLINFLLEDKDIKSTIDPSVVDDLYNKYVISLINSYIIIKGKLTKMANKLIEEHMKAEFSTFLTNQPLVITLLL